MYVKEQGHSARWSQFGGFTRSMSMMSAQQRQSKAPFVVLPPLDVVRTQGRGQDRSIADRAKPIRTRTAPGQHPHQRSLMQMERNESETTNAHENAVQWLWSRLRCRKGDDDGEYLPGWDGPRTEEGEWMEWIEERTPSNRIKEKPREGEGTEPIEEKTPPSGAGGRLRHSRRDEARRRVLTKASWTDAIHRLEELDIGDLDVDAFPDLTSDKELEAAVNGFDSEAVLDVPGDAAEGPSGANAEHRSAWAMSIGSLYSDDSVLIELREKSRLQDDSSVVSDLSFDGDVAQTQAEVKSRTRRTSNPQAA